MPIADDIKKFYPDDWEEIRERVLERAASRESLVGGADAPNPPCYSCPTAPAFDPDLPQCEFCGKPNGEYVRTTSRGEWSSVYAQSHWFDARGHEIDYEPAPIVRCVDDPLKIVLTIAHLDQDPRGDDIDRLSALCQRCHLTYDAHPVQRRKREMIYAELRGQQVLFVEGRQ